MGGEKGVGAREREAIGPLALTCLPCVCFFGVCLCDWNDQFKSNKSGVVCED